jgi:hypothetical protein
MAKGMVIPLATAGLFLLGVPIPHPLGVTLIFGSLGLWIVFVLVNTLGPALRLMQAHDAYMKAIGLNIDIVSTLSDRELWKRSHANMTMREFIAY